MDPGSFTSGLGVVAIRPVWLPCGYAGAGAAHGGEHVCATMDVPRDRRPQPATHDADDATRIHRDVRELPIGTHHLLVDQQPFEHRSTVLNQS